MVIGLVCSNNTILLIPPSHYILPCPRIDCGSSTDDGVLLLLSIGFISPPRLPQPDPQLLHRSSFHFPLIDLLSFTIISSRAPLSSPKCLRRHRHPPPFLVSVIDRHQVAIIRSGVLWKGACLVSRQLAPVRSFLLAFVSLEKKPTPPWICALL